jgi:hypothetical protein
MAQRRYRGYQRRPEEVTKAGKLHPHLDTRLRNGKVQPYDFSRRSNRMFRPPTGLTPADKAVYEYLCSRADAYGWCCPSVEEIAVGSEVHVETTRACLRHLDTQGWIKRTWRPYPWHTEYIVLRPPCRGPDEPRTGDHPAFTDGVTQLRALVPNPTEYKRRYDEWVATAKRYQREYGWSTEKAYGQAFEDVRVRVLAARTRKKV